MASPSRPNRLLEVDPFPGKEIDLWHADDAGDWRELVFEVPVWAKPDAIAKAFREMGSKWIDWLDKKGMQVQTQTIQCHGPYPCLELSKLDMQQLVISARVKRVRPEKMLREEAEPFFSTQPENANKSVSQVFKGPQRMGPKAIERNARMQEEARKRAPAVVAAHEEIARERERRGLPAFEPDLKELEDED